MSCVFRNTERVDEYSHNINLNLYLNSRVFGVSPPHFVHYNKKDILVKLGYDYSPHSIAPKWLKNGKIG